MLIYKYIDPPPVNLNKVAQIFNSQSEWGRNDIIQMER